MNAPKVNDIYVGVMHYSMKIVSFYQVVNVTPSGKSIKLQKLGNTQVSGDGHTGKVVPALNEVVSNEFITRRIMSKSITSDVNKVKLGDYHYARPWNGEPVSFDHLD